MERVLSWLLFFILLFLIVYLIIIFIKKYSRKVIGPFIIIFLFFAYSFFSTRGSIRLAIALAGHPVKAYTTGLKRNLNNYGTNNSYYAPTKDIKTISGSMLYFECKTYGIIKISSYYGF